MGIVGQLPEQNEVGLLEYVSTRKLLDRVARIAGRLVAVDERDAAPTRGRVQERDRTSSDEVLGVGLIWRRSIARIVHPGPGFRTLAVGCR